MEKQPENQETSVYTPRYESAESLETATDNLRQSWYAHFTSSALWNYVNTGNQPRDLSRRPQSEEMIALKESSFEEFLKTLSSFNNAKEAQKWLDGVDQQDDLFEKFGMIPTSVMRAMLGGFCETTLIEDYIQNIKKRG